MWLSQLRSHSDTVLFIWLGVLRSTTFLHILCLIVLLLNLLSKLRMVFAYAHVLYLILILCLLLRNWHLLNCNLVLAYILVRKLYYWFKVVIDVRLLYIPHIYPLCLSQHCTITSGGILMLSYCWLYCIIYQIYVILYINSWAQLFDFRFHCTGCVSFINRGWMIVLSRPNTNSFFQVSHFVLHI